MDSAADLRPIDASASDKPRDGSRESIVPLDVGLHDTTPKDHALGDQRPKDQGPNGEAVITDGASTRPKFVDISKGTFTMGAIAGTACRGNNEDQHTVTLTRNFRIQLFEVTQGQFQTRMGYNPSTNKKCGPTCPVENVTWHEAAAYCNALSTKNSLGRCYRCSGSGQNVTCDTDVAYTKKKIYTCPGYRLPTEAEFEYAYRAQTTTDYYNGSADPKFCRTCGDQLLGQIARHCTLQFSTPVGRYLPNKWGLYDMAGNVAEWCHDWYVASLGSGPVVDPWGAPPGTYKVARGGSWFHFAASARASARTFLKPSAAAPFYGLRCVQSVP